MIENNFLKIIFISALVISAQSSASERSSDSRVISARSGNQNVQGVFGQGLFSLSTAQDVLGFRAGFSRGDTLIFDQQKYTVVRDELIKKGSTEFGSGGTEESRELMLEHSGLCGSTKLLLKQIAHFSKDRGSSCQGFAYQERTYQYSPFAKKLMIGTGLAAVAAIAAGAYACFKKKQG